MSLPLNVASNQRHVYYGFCFMRCGALLVPSYMQVHTGSSRFGAVTSQARLQARCVRFHLQNFDFTTYSSSVPPLGSHVKDCIIFQIMSVCTAHVRYVGIAVVVLNISRRHNIRLTCPDDLVFEPLYYIKLVNCVSFRRRYCAKLVNCHT